MEENSVLKTQTVDVVSSVVVVDLGEGIFRVDGKMVAGAPKMLAAVTAALHIDPKPRAPRKAKK